MLDTKTNRFFGERNLISVFTTSHCFNTGNPKLLGFIEKQYFPNNETYKVTLSKSAGLKFTRYPRVTNVKSIQNGLRFLAKAELKIKEG